MGTIRVSLHPSVPTPPTTPDQCSSLPLCLAVLSAQGVSRTTLMCGDTWQARWPLGLSLITLDPNPSGIKPAKPNSHCGSWLAGICCNCCRGGGGGSGCWGELVGGGHVRGLRPHKCLSFKRKRGEIRARNWGAESLETSCKVWLKKNTHMYSLMSVG